MSVQDTSTRDSLRLESDKLVYDWGWIDCEERIIKLLEEHLIKMGARATSHEQALIKLIKGETNE